MIRKQVIIPVLLALLAACNKSADNPAAANGVGPTAGSVPTAAAVEQKNIDFSKEANPGFVKEIRGMSGPEPKGRWTDGPSAVFVFKEPLQGKVKLTISAQPYGPNAGKDVAFIFGGMQKTLVFKQGIDDFQTLSVDFDLPGPADSLEIRIPEPTVPPGGNRRLGLFIAQIKFD